jgi:hypothetical protein
VAHSTLRFAARLSIAGLVCSVAAFGQLTQHERDLALSYLYSSQKQFIDSVAGLSADQLNFKPAPDRWSIAECAEHIMLSEDMIFGLVTTQIMKSPAVEPKLPAAEREKNDMRILAAVESRDKKMTAPAQLKPTGTVSSVPDAVAHFNASRTITLDYVRTGQDDLRRHYGTHPALGAMDAYDWILMLAAHTERHTAQIKEIKADPNFPKS